MVHRLCVCIHLPSQMRKNMTLLLIGVQHRRKSAEDDHRTGRFIGTSSSVVNQLCFITRCACCFWMCNVFTFIHYTRRLKGIKTRQNNHASKHPCRWCRMSVSLPSAPNKKKALTWSSWVRNYHHWFHIQVLRLWYATSLIPMQGSPFAHPAQTRADNLTRKDDAVVDHRDRDRKSVV